MLFGKKEAKVFSVEGMMCMHCAKKVEDAVKKIKGVKKVTPDVEKKTVAVTFSGDVDTQAVTTAIEMLGYTVNGVDR